MRVGIEARQSPSLDTVFTCMREGLWPSFVGLDYFCFPPTFDLTDLACFSHCRSLAHSLVVNQTDVCSCVTYQAPARSQGV